jgi:hypothetical protein
MMLSIKKSDLMPRFFKAAMVKRSENIAVIAAGKDFRRRALLFSWRSEAQVLPSLALLTEFGVIQVAASLEVRGDECQSRQICGCLAAKA